MYKSVFQIIVLFLIPYSLMAQCPEKGWLRNRIIFLRDSSHSPAKLQLKELIKYEENSKSCSFQNDSVRVLLLQRLSKIYTDSCEEYTQAINYLNRSVNLVSANENNPAINAASQVRNYYNLALCYRYLKKISLRTRAYDSCITVARRLGIVNLIVIYSLTEKVKYLNSVGEYRSCIGFADIGESLSHQYIPQKNMESYGDSTSFALDFAIQKINALVATKEIAQAEKAILEKIEQCRKKSDKKHVGSFSEQLALIKAKNKDYKESRRYFDQAVSSYLNIKDTLSYKIALQNIGFTIYHEKEKDDDAAMRYYKKALSYHVRDPDRQKLDSITSITMYCNIASIFVNKQLFDSAWCYFKYAFDQVKKGITEDGIVASSNDEFIQNQNLEHIINLFIDKANAYYKQYQFTHDKSSLEKAIKVYKLIDQLLDKIKKNQVELYSKLFWRKSMHYLYEKAIDVCIEGGKKEDAYYFFERSRAILLFDQIDEQSWLGEADISKRQELSERISKLEKDLAGANQNTSQFDKIRNEITELNERKARLGQQIQERNPLYYQSFVMSNFTTLGEVHRYLSQQGQAMVEIFAGESNMYSMVIDADSVYLHKINKAAYDNAISVCISYMSDWNLSNKKRMLAIFEKNSKLLYDLIFGKDKLQPARVIISTDGKYFPFEALVTDFENNQPVYFIQKHAVSYTYSARYLMNQFSRQSSFATGKFLGIAPINFSKNTGLASLAGSDSAVIKIRSLYDGGNLLLNQDATRSTFLKKFGKYEIIQLYSHSSDSSDNGEPVIHFADQSLYLSELSNIETPSTKLVVLSACETGEGQLYQGEGVFSFSRGFAALGISSCISNLWSVNNESTYAITEIFHRYVAEGLSLDVALQKAKLEFINSLTPEHKVPYYWAATILVGKSDAIILKNNQTLYIVFISIAAAAFIALAWTLTNFINKTMKRRSLRT